MLYAGVRNFHSLSAFSRRRALARASIRLRAASSSPLSSWPNVAIVSWSGCVSPLRYRAAMSRWVVRSMRRLEKTPLAYQ